MQSVAFEPLEWVAGNWDGFRKAVKFGLKSLLCPWVMIKADRAVRETPRKQPFE